MTCLLCPPDTLPAVSEPAMYKLEPSGTLSPCVLISSTGKVTRLLKGEALWQVSVPVQTESRLRLRECHHFYHLLSRQLSPYSVGVSGRRARILSTGRVVLPPPYGRFLRQGQRPRAHHAAPHSYPPDHCASWHTKSFKHRRMTRKAQSSAGFGQLPWSITGSDQYKSRIGPSATLNQSHI